MDEALRAHPNMTRVTDRVRTLGEIVQPLQTEPHVFFGIQHSLAPTPAQCAHVAACSLCRGALAVLLAERISVAPQPPIDCNACMHDLAALIDLQRSVGILLATREYPVVWWHLWCCSLCAESYALTCDLLAAESSHEPRMHDVPTVA